MTKPVATHMSRQNGHVNNSPRLCRNWLACPVSSITSAGPPVRAWWANGARSGLVTASLVNIRDSLCVLRVTISRSSADHRNGSLRPVTATTKLVTATSVR